MQLAVIADMTAKSTDVRVCSACFWANSHCVQVQVQAPFQAAHEERLGHVAQDLLLPQLSFLGAPMGVWLHICSRALKQRSLRWNQPLYILFIKLRAWCEEGHTRVWTP